ncbi:unnamed protein product [Bursaphelenchus okinawaensis]|uniref:ADP-ribosylation factor-related protein 1 n=1 Tax=Bursaphelenchus okinawaensis TaxID=465554 RepID=A0A811JVD3_9BILA|nr:unnamed protein product [Bursaphelenchus okinawaensis]CAG9084980.1 unnamed protein product [Bursaphelenchus okinawaensis]
MVRKEEYFVLVCGAEGVGKTTFAEQLRVQCDSRFKMPKRTTSTIGLNLVKFETDGFILNLWDVGGNVELQDLWTKYLDDCHAIIFVAETTTDTGKIKESLQAFDRVQSHKKAPTVPLMILMNKSDQLEEIVDDCHIEGRIRDSNISRGDLFKFIEKQENTPIGVVDTSFLVDKEAKVVDKDVVVDKAAKVFNKDAKSVDDKVKSTENNMKVVVKPQLSDWQSFSIESTEPESSTADDVNHKLQNHFDSSQNSSNLSEISWKNDQNSSKIDRKPSPNPQKSTKNGWTETDDEQYDQFKAYGWDFQEPSHGEGAVKEVEDGRRGQNDVVVGGNGEIDVGDGKNGQLGLESASRYDAVHSRSTVDDGEHGRSHQNDVDNGRSQNGEVSRNVDVQDTKKDNDNSEDIVNLMEVLRERADDSHRADMAVFSISALKVHNLERCR